MPELVETNDRPEPQNLDNVLRPFVFHGVDLYDSRHEEITTLCPFCGRDNKFSVNQNTGQWQCFVCRTGSDRGGGNAYTFIRTLWQLSLENTRETDYQELAIERKLLFPSTLVKWGVCRSITTGDWLIPGFGIDRALNQLYKYVKDFKTGRNTLFPTPELHHQLHGANLFNDRCSTVYICEGPWDGMAWWEVLRAIKGPNTTSEGTVVADAMTVTGNEAVSMLASSSVVAIPGCGAVGQPLTHWTSLFSGKRVVIMADSDHPRMQCKKCKKSWSSAINKVCPTCKGPLSGPVVAPAGYKATERAAQILTYAEGPPETIHFVRWGDKGFDPTKPSGYDVRDCLSSKGQTVAARIAGVKELLGKITPMPPEWISGRSPEVARRGGTEIDCIPCHDWKELVQAWEQAMKWTEGLERALSVMLASVASTKIVGDQLWVKIMGPAGCGKSTLCEALSINRKYIAAKSMLTGFVSGYQTDKEGEEDHGLIPKIAGKTLVTKDGDTLLKAENLGKILSQARDLYDGTTRSHYGNKMGKDYEGVRMTWILCGTSSLSKIDSSELGERFLDCQIMDSIDTDLEDEVLWKVAERTDRLMSFEADGKAETHHDPDLVAAMQLTGGYVTFLRENARRLLSKIHSSREALRTCVHYAKFVAYMRARPSLHQDETAEREFAARLVSQHIRLAKCLAVVLNRKELDEEVLRRVKRVTLDTAGGTTLDIATALYKAGVKGSTHSALAHWTDLTDDKARKLLRFLRKIGVVEGFTREGELTRTRWRLTQRMLDLYREVMINAD